MKKECYRCKRVGEYSTFLRTKYGMCGVLFEGYEEHSTKDQEHKTRQTGNVSATVVKAEKAQVHKYQQALFSNEKYKTHFINPLKTHLSDIGHRVEVSRGDADTLIISNSLEFVQNGQTVKEDTCVLVTLVYLWRNCMEDIFIGKEPKLSRPGEMFSIKESTSAIPVVIQIHGRSVMHVVAMTPTSANFGHGRPDMSHGNVGYHMYRTCPPE